VTLSGCTLEKRKITTPTYRGDYDHFHPQEILLYLCIWVDKIFDIIFLDEAFSFMSSLEKNKREKIFYNIRRAQAERDPEIFKKLTEEIWEFRTLFMGLQYRLLAFWDKSDQRETLVVSTHGFIKKQSKVPDREIQKAKQMRTKYFEDKEKQKKTSK